MFNLNTITIGVFRLLSSGATTELYNGKPNRFSHASAFIMQPSIVELVETVNKGVIENPYYNVGLAISELIRNYNNKYNNITGNFVKTDNRLANLFTTNQLIDFIKNRNIKDADYYKNQIDVLLAFKEYNEISDSITDLTFVLKTDTRTKTFFNSDIREAKLADYYIDKAQYNVLLIETLNKSFNFIKDYSNSLENSKEIITDFNNYDTFSFREKYNNIKLPKSFITVASYYTEFEDFSNLITRSDRKNKIELLGLNYKPISKFTVDGKDIIDVVFTGSDFTYIKDDIIQPFYNESAYGIIQARQQYGHWMFANSFNDVFAQRSLGMRKAVRSFLISNGKVYDERASRFIESRIFDYYTQQLGDESVPMMYNIPKKTIQNILGIVPDTEKALHTKYIKDLLGNLNKDVTNEKFAKWATLTLEEQINLINNDKTLLAYINKIDFRFANIFKYITIQKNSVERYGYTVIRVVKDDSNNSSNDDVASGILTMYKSNIPYIAHTIRNLIAYTYITEGFQYGANISKYIPMELLGKPVINENYNNRITQIGIVDPTIGLSDYTTILRNAESKLINGEVDIIDDALDYASRQNPSINITIQNDNIKKTLDKENLNTATLGWLNNANGDNVGRIEVVDADGKDRVIILETKARVQNSRYSNARYVTDRRNNNVIIYKRSDSFSYNSNNSIRDVYYYCPVGRLLSNEFAETSIIEKYNISDRIQVIDSEGNVTTMPVDTFVKTSGIFDTFLLTLNNRLTNNFGDITIDHDTLVDGIDIKVDSDYIVEDISYEPEELSSEDILSSNEENILFSKKNYFEDVDYKLSEKSLIETIKEEVSKANNLIYIGNSKNIISNIYDGVANFIHVNFTENPYSEADRISKELKSGKYLIVGDTFEDAGITSNTGITWTRNFINRLYQNNGNIDSINTIMNEGFGLAVSQTYVDTERNNTTLIEPEVLFSKTIKIDKPSNIGVEARTSKNSIIALKAYESLDKLRRFLDNNKIPNTESILDAYKQFNKEDYEGSLRDDIASSDYNAVNIAFANMVPIMEATMDSVRYLLTDVEAVNTDTIRNDYAKWQDYKSKVNYLRELTQSFTKFKDIQEIKIQDTVYNPENEDDVELYHEEFDGVNESIKKLSKLYNESIALTNRILDKVRDIIVDLVVTQSRNPNYATSFSKILEAARKDDFDPEEFNIEDLKITSEEYNSILGLVFNLKGQNPSFYQKTLDSPFVTGVTLPDIIGKQYTTTRYESNKKVNAILDKVDDAIKELERSSGENLSTDKAISDYFKRFVNSYGGLIDTYNYGTVYDEIEMLREKIHELYQNKYYGNPNINTNLIEYLIREVDNYIDSFNRKSVSTLTRLSEEEEANLNELMISKSKTEQDAYIKLNNYFVFNIIKEVGGTPEKVIFKLNFKESAKDPRYAALKDYDQKFISTIKSIIQEVIKDYNPNWIEYNSRFGNVFPYLAKADVKFNIDNFVGLPSIRKDSTYEGLDGRTKYALHSNTLSIPNYYHNFDIPKRRIGEMWDDYTDRVVREFNNWYKKDTKKLESSTDITNYYQIKDYVQLVRTKNFEESVNRRSYNIRDGMQAFTKEVYNIKSIRDFSVDYELGLFALKESGKNNKLENLINMYEAQERRVYNTSRVTRSIDIAAKAILRYTSINYMWFNWSAGLKNVVKGISDMIIDSSKMNYLTSKELMQGLLDIVKITPEWIAEHGKEKTKNPYIALIKDFEVIFQDTRDMNVSITGDSWLTKVLTTADTLGYSANQIGEFIMQFGMLLGMSRSHRVIGGRIMSFADYYNDDKIKILQELLTDEQKIKYYEFVKAKNDYIIKYEEDNNKKYLWTNDYAGDFLRANPELLSSEQRKEFIKLVRDNKKQYEAKFNKFPTFESIIKVKNGRLSYDESTGLNDVAVNEFKERVKAVNQALHGIYTQIDKNALQENAFTDLFMQFRKWMRPNWVRYFGRRFNRPTFNENLGSFEIPIYKPIFDAATYGYRMFKEDADITKMNIIKDPKSFFKGLYSMFNYQLKLLRHARFYYNTLSKGEQASLIKWAKHTAAIAIVATLALSLGSLQDDDEPYYYTALMYTLTALYKEVSEPVPLYGWYSTLNQLKEKAFIGEQVIVNLMNLIKYAMADIFTDDESIYYDRGVYKGQKKSIVALNRLIPILSQIQKSTNLKAQMNWYKWYNPFTL